MKKCLIIPYFGKLPNYFDFFLESCASNTDFDFLLFTDQVVKAGKENIFVYHYTWEEFTAYINDKLGDDFGIKQPYKLCDFRPAYGLIFSDYIEGYDYWGHCDCDLIFGQLSLLNPYFEKGYERIGQYGHLILYKNTPVVNNYFRTLTDASVASWDVVSKSSTSYSFDEFGGMNRLCDANDINCSHPRLFDDLIFYKKAFYSRRAIENDIDPVKVPMYFEFKDGVLLRWYFFNGRWSKDTSLYVHFQKRKMEVRTQDRNNFLMIPNAFVSTSEYDKDYLKRKCTQPLFDLNNIKVNIKFYLKHLTPNT